MVAGIELPFSLQCQLRRRCKHLICPSKQIVFRGLPGTDVFPSGLVDGKLDTVNLIDPFKSIQSGCGITHKLTVVFGCYRDSDSVLVIDDVKQTVCYDHAIAGSEAFWYPS